VLRDFSPRDQEAVCELILGGMRERWGARFDANANPDVGDMSTSYLSQGAEIVIAEHDGRVVATGTLLLAEDDAGRIVRVAVDRQHRRRGIARSVVLELVARARRHNMRTVIVTTDPPWLDAVSLYESCGFEIAAKTEESIYLTIPLG
jgi:ribosomal protein S18 acetylase RimI-like enzyme